MIFNDFLQKFIKPDQEKQKAASNQFTSENNDGAIEVEDNFTNFLFSLDWRFGDQVSLINMYREIAQYQDVDYAIEDIINEMVSFSEDEDAIELNLEDIDESILSKRVKEIIYDRWEKITNVLELNETIHRRARHFYVDGRLAYHKVIDRNAPRKGLIGVVELDTKYVKKIRNIKYDPDRTIESIDEHFIYDESPSSSEGNKSAKRDKTPMQIHPEALCYVTSGLVDQNTGLALSWLHKAVKPANQLKLMENALLIYRITRAPERRIFNVSTGGLPKSKSEQYIKNLMNSYRNRMSYDPDKGSFKDNRHLMTMQEDFWFAKDATGKGTEVSTLAGGQQLGEVEDVLYFLKRLYKALNVPLSRLENDGQISFGRQAEISRDELKFSKMVSKIRKRFNLMFLDLLRTELLLTKVITEQEWGKIENLIEFRYSQDLYLEEQKKHELLRDRLDLANEFKPYVGMYFSHDYIQKRVFDMTETEIEEELKQIEKEESIARFQPKEDF